MHKFDLKKINSIHGKQSIEKLVVDDVCYYDDFIKELKRTRRGASQVASIYAIIKDYADCKGLPKAKFKFLETSDDEQIRR